MRIAVDTNVLIYAEGWDDTSRRARARFVLEGLSAHELVLPVQVAGEFYNVLVRKLRRTEGEAAATVTAWSGFFAHRPATDWRTLTDALDLASRHRIPAWDAIILSAAAATGCTLLLSEDFGEGFAWRGVTIANPFADEPHALLADALDHGGTDS